MNPLRPAEILAVALLIALCMILALADVARRLSDAQQPQRIEASVESTQDPSNAIDNDAFSVPFVTISYLSGDARARLDEAARRDDWRAIDAASAAARGRAQYGGFLKLSAGQPARCRERCSAGCSSR